MSQGSSPIRVLVVDDDRLFAEAVATVVCSTDWAVLVGTASHGDEAVALAASLEPDLVLMDLDMPGMDGIEATARIRERVSSACVLIVSGSAERERIALARRAGAAGYVLKSEMPFDLVPVLLGLGTAASAAAA
jgi:DNA-binding NarL/FixJ family response regulator